MADLTIVATWTCATNIAWEQDVQSAKDLDKTYKVSWGPTPNGECQYGWHCECHAFHFSKKGNKTCKHVDQIKHKRCAWNESMNAFVDAKYDCVGAIGEPRCPRCRGPVDAVGVAI